MLTTHSTQGLFRLPAKSLKTLLLELHTLRQRIRAGERFTLPEITLLLDAGQSLTGELISFTEADLAEDRMVLLKNRNSQGTWDVSYIPFANIDGLTVHFTADNLHLLSFGKLKPFSSQVPSRLDLERQLRLLVTPLNQGRETDLEVAIAWNELPQSDEALQSLALLLTELEAILASVQSDEIGRTALREKVQRLEIRVAIAPGVALRDRCLQILVKIEDHDLLCLSKTDLQFEIEFVL